MPTEDLTTRDLLLAFLTMTDPDRVPAEIRDPQVRMQLRALGLGDYTADAAELASRRVDLRAEGVSPSATGQAGEDDDPGPLPMEEAPEEGIEATLLDLSGAEKP